MAYFVVHEHHASHLHFDLRLETDGVLKSFAIPKGPSLNPSEKRLAIAVDDHPLSYATFEGIIPKGFYGAGYVVIWDKGTYNIKKGTLAEGLMELEFNGEKMKGVFILKKIRNDIKNWLFFKKTDKYADKNFKLSLSLTEEKKKILKEMEEPCHLR